jgi:hypothetical protein
MHQSVKTCVPVCIPYIRTFYFHTRSLQVKPGWPHWLPQWIDARCMYQAIEQVLLSVAFLNRELLGRDSDILPPPLTADDKAAAEEAVAAAADGDAESEQEGGEGTDQDSEEDGQE